MHRKTTLKKLADELGVSRTTVSYVLSGQARQRRVSEKTAQRILLAARKHNYVPNAIARSLRVRRTGTIGVIVSGFTLDHTQRLFSGMDPVFGHEDRLPIFAVRRWDPERERRELNDLLERRVDGLLVVNPLEANRDAYRRVIDQGVPLIFLCDTLEDAPWANYIIWDSGPAARVAVQHLIDTGHRRIAFFSSAHRMRMHAARARAFQQTLRDNGLAVRREWIREQPLSRVGHGDSDYPAWVRRLFSDPAQRPDAVFALNDGVAIQAARILNQIGLAVPDDVSIIGMSNMRIWTDDGLGLTTMDEPLTQIGEHAARALGRLIDGNPKTRIQEAIHHNELIVRQTTRGPRAAGDAI